MPLAPFFCDINKETIGKLSKRLEGDSEAAASSVLLNGDNNDAIDVFAEMVRRNETAKMAVGCVLIDPNGYFYPTQVPAAKLDAFCGEFERIDLIMNLNLRTFNMQRAQGHAVMAPSLLLRSLRKKHWLVAQANVGQARFLLVVGRNFQTGDHKALGLHDLTSDIGQQIINRADGQRQYGMEYEVSELSGVSSPSGLLGSQSCSDAPRERQVPMRSDSDGSASHKISDVGDLRRSNEHGSHLPRLPLFGAWEE